MALTVLLVDDEKSFHILIDRIIGDEFDVLHAYNAQEAIDYAAEVPIHLIISDFKMPEMNGLELLDSVQKDQQKRQIPFLLITGYEREELEQQAYDLGAADFISKSEIVENRELLLERIRLKIVSEVDLPGLDADLAKSKTATVKQVLQEAIKNDFMTVAHSLIEALDQHFNADHVSLWLSKDPEPNLIAESGKPQLQDLPYQEISNDQGFQQVREQVKPYLTNHIDEADPESLRSFCQTHNLSARLVVPLFKVSEKKLLMENLEVPESAEVYGYVMLLRSELFSTKEYDLLSNLGVRLGAILWRLYSKSN